MDRSIDTHVNFENILEQGDKKPKIKNLNINASERAKKIFRDNLLMSKDVSYTINHNPTYKNENSRRDLINELYNYKEQILNSQVEKEIEKYRQYKITK